MATFGDRLYHMGGVPVDGLFTMGKAFFVRPGTGSDGNSGLKPNQALATLSKALSLCTANKGDVVYLIAEGNSSSATTDYQSSTLTWNKDGVHLIGIDCGGMIGQRARIAQLSTVKTIENLVTVSANNCLIHNIGIYQGVASSTATSPVALLVSGDRNVISNCQISGNGDTGGSTDTAGARSLNVTGSENLFKHCYIGLDTVIRATQTSEVACITGRNIFEDCMIHSYTDLSTFKAIQAVTSVTGRFIMMKNCLLSAIQNITSAVAPTGAVAHGASIEGNTFLHNSAVYGYANVATADDARTLVYGSRGGQVDMGLATAIDIA